MNAHDKQLSVILPCAGRARRLGLHTPKELLEVVPGKRLIDFSLDHIDSAPMPCMVVVVIRRGKESVYEYVRDRLKATAHQTLCVDAGEADNEWVGSIFSAREFFAPKNAVLLPDSFLSLSKENHRYDLEGKTLCDLVLRALHLHPFCLGAIRCEDPHLLRSLGALQLDDQERVLAFQDKPVNPSHYNAFWGCFGFEKRMANELEAFLGASVRKEATHYEAQSFYLATAFPVYEYQDLGTPESLEAFRSRNL